MKTQYYAAASLDGYIATPDDRLDWLFQCGSLEETGYAAFFSEVGALAMGSTSYEWILDHMKLLEPSTDARWPYEPPTWVFTTRDLPKPEGADIRLVSGEVRPVHAAMVEAAGEKNVWLVGGGELVGQFYDAGLLDEIIVQLTPVFLGAGKPLLPRNISHPPLKVQAVERYGPSFVELRLAVSQTLVTE